MNVSYFARLNRHKEINLENTNLILKKNYYLITGLLCFIILAPDLDSFQRL